jgi:hypothetical protein
MILESIAFGLVDAEVFPGLFDDFGDSISH